MGAGPGGDGRAAREPQRRFGGGRPTGSGPLFFQRVPERKQAKNRVHLDVRAAPGLKGDARMAALEVEAARLSHGATRPERYEPAPALGAGHILMADTEGNEICLD